jgi:hypothetical protein
MHNSYAAQQITTTIIIMCAQTTLNGQPAPKKVYNYVCRTHTGASRRNVAALCDAQRVRKRLTTQQTNERPAPTRLFVVFGFRFFANTHLQHFANATTKTIKKQHRSVVLTYNGTFVTGSDERKCAMPL